MPDSARQLRLSDFWDGYAPTYDDPIEVHLELADFMGDPALVALLTDFRTPMHSGQLSPRPSRVSVRASTTADD